MFLYAFLPGIWTTKEGSTQYNWEKNLLLQLSLQINHQNMTKDPSKYLFSHSPD